MLQLLLQAKANFTENNIFIKLFRRLWKKISAYEQGQSYAKVLQLFFSSHCLQTVIFHRRITNRNIDDS